MKRCGALAVTGLLLACNSIAWAQEAPVEEEAVRRLCGEFFDALQQAGAQGAAGYLRKSGTIEDDVLRELEREAQARLLANPAIGRPDSWAIVRETGIPYVSRYRSVYAVTYHDGKPVGWRMRFYRKVTGVWVFTDIDWESQFVEDFLLMPGVEFAAYRRLLARTPSASSSD
jgi:hypothetical protein